MARKAPARYLDFSTPKNLAWRRLSGLVRLHDADAKRITLCWWKARDRPGRTVCKATGVPPANRLSIRPR